MIFIATSRTGKSVRFKYTSVTSSTQNVIYAKAVDYSMCELYKFSLNTLKGDKGFSININEKDKIREYQKSKRLGNA